MTKFKLILAGIVALMLAISSYFVFGSYSEGYRAGKIMKLSKKGYLIKTYEGQLDVGGLQAETEDGAATTVWSFSVKNEAVINEINSAVDQGYHVKLHYHERFYRFFHDTKYMVFKVEKINSTPKSLGDTTGASM
jgi:hypothetical protein